MSFFNGRWECASSVGDRRRHGNSRQFAEIGPNWKLTALGLDNYSSEKDSTIQAVEHLEHPTGDSYTALNNTTDGTGTTDQLGWFQKPMYQVPWSVWD